MRKNPEIIFAVFAFIAFAVFVYQPNLLTAGTALLLCIATLTIFEIRQRADDAVKDGADTNQKNNVDGLCNAKPTGVIELQKLPKLKRKIDSANIDKRTLNPKEMPGNLTKH